MKRIIGYALLMALAAEGLVRGQEQELPAPRPYAEDGAVTPVNDETPPEMPGLSPWIRYSHARCECCGPMGADGPIAYEVYFRTGPSIPAFGGKIHEALDTGWLWAGGGRSLFFEVDQLRAWTVDLSLSHTYNSSSDNTITFVVPVTTGDLIPTTENRNVSVRAMHRTYVSASIGREFYLVGLPYEVNRNWRAGWDLGARLGSARLDLNELDGLGRPDEFERLGCTTWALFGALHTDVEFPCGCWAWFLGFRCEFDRARYEFRHINSNEIWNVNLLGTVGMRF